IQGSIFGLPSNIGLNLGLGVQYNNYQGITFHPSFGVSFGIHDNVQVGMNISTSTADGATVSPSVSFTSAEELGKDKDRKLSHGVGLSLNSRQGLNNFSFNSSLTKSSEECSEKIGDFVNRSSSFSNRGILSLNNNNNYTPF